MANKTLFLFCFLQDSTLNHHHAMLTTGDAKV